MIRFVSSSIASLIADLQVVCFLSDMLTLEPCKALLLCWFFSAGLQLPNNLFSGKAAQIPNLSTNFSTATYWPFSINFVSIPEITITAFFLGFTCISFVPVLHIPSYN